MCNVLHKRKLKVGYRCNAEIAPTKEGYRKQQSLLHCGHTCKAERPRLIHRYK